MAKPVIIVEDDADVREELELALRREGFDVHCASNGRDGLYLLAGLGDRPVLLLDLMMPVMSGWDVLSWLRCIGSSAPVIAITAVTSAEAPTGAVAFLRKPLDLDVLLPLVRQHAA